MKRLILSGCLMGTFSLCFTQKPWKPDLPDLLKENKIEAVNREAAGLNDQQFKNGIHLDARPGPGIAWIGGFKLGAGTIEFDVKGKDVLQKSFVGIAFNGINDSAYEAVYFRPFNFNVKDKNRKLHAVQYMALPGFEWDYLRSDFPGTFESGLQSEIAPDSWFHIKIVIDTASVHVTVNRDKKACLSVKRLVPGSVGKIGFWVGNNSDGDFANLVVTSK